MNFEWEWTNPEPVPKMTVPQAQQIISCVCNDWRKVHPEDKGLPWQKIIFKVLRWRALAGGYSMFVSYSDNRRAILDFRMIDRKEFPIPFHG